MNTFSVREITSTDIDLIISYWLGADETFLNGMGADIAKIPSADEWENMLTEQINLPYNEKKSYCIIWLYDGKPVGHSNVNKILYGEEAYMHLHLWKADKRQKGMGTALVKMSLPYFFDHLQLKKIYCEPYTLNPAPNKTLEKVGFIFIKEYITVPGILNFEQSVKLWELSEDRFRNIK